MGNVSHCPKCAAASSGSSGVGKSSSAVISEQLSGLISRNAQILHIYRFKEKLDQPLAILGLGMFHEGVILKYEVKSHDPKALLLTAADANIEQLAIKYMKIDWGKEGLGVIITDEFPMLRKPIDYSSQSKFMESALPRLSAQPLLVLLASMYSSGFSYDGLVRNCQHFSQAIWDIYVMWKGDIPKPPFKSILNKIWPGLSDAEVERRFDLATMSFSVKAFNASEAWEGEYEFESITHDGRPIYMNKCGKYFCMAKNHWSLSQHEIVPDPENEGKMIDIITAVVLVLERGDLPALGLWRDAQSFVQFEVQQIRAAEKHEWIPVTVPVTVLDRQLLMTS